MEEIWSLISDATKNKIREACYEVLRRVDTPQQDAGAGFEYDDDARFPDYSGHTQSVQSCIYQICRLEFYFVQFVIAVSIKTLSYCMCSHWIHAGIGPLAGMPSLSGCGPAVLL